MNQSMSKLDVPARGFPISEFEHRTERTQELMRQQRIDALFLTTEPEVRYFSGFHSQFWESPTRPWYLIMPLEGKPIAIIPEIGAAGMHTTWLNDIRTWSSPQPEDDGVSLVTDTLKQLPSRYGRIGVPMGHETLVRMPALDFKTLTVRLSNKEFIDAGMLIRSIRAIKSELEIEKIRHVCELTSDGFIDLPNNISTGESERDICRKLKIDLLERGADDSPYVVTASGPNGYDNIIMGPTDRVLSESDVLIIDTGTTFDGYFCDFDRNFAFGAVSDACKRAHDVVYQATEAGINAARPGATPSDLAEVMWKILQQGGALGNDIGRLGHGLGMQLTEGLSNMPGDDTVLKAGMVITIEPGMCFAPGKLMVHEENIVIREGEAELLSKRAQTEMPVIG